MTDRLKIVEANSRKDADTLHELKVGVLLFLFFHFLHIGLYESPRLPVSMRVSACHWTVVGWLVGCPEYVHFIYYIIQGYNVGKAIVTLTEAVERIQKQMHVQGRDSLRQVGGLEERLLMLEEQIGVVSEEMHESCQEMVDAVRREITESIVKVVDRVAQQFDDIQASMDAREAEHVKHMEQVVDEMAQSHKDGMDRLREMWNESFDRAMDAVDKRVLEIREDVERVRDEQASTSARLDKEIMPGLASLQGCMSTHDKSLESIRELLREDVDAIKGQVQGSLESLSHQVDDKTRDLSSKFSEYKSYVARLRHELYAVKEEFKGSQETLIKRVSLELDSAEENIAALREHFKSKQPLKPAVSTSV